MPGTQNVRGRTCTQNCTHAMSGLCSLRLEEVLPQVFYSGLSLASPCWKLRGHEWGLERYRVWESRRGLNQLCIKGPKCLYLKMFSLGKSRFFSEGSSAFLRKNEPDWHSGALPWGERGWSSPFHVQMFNTLLFSGWHSTLLLPGPQVLNLSGSVSPDNKLLLREWEIRSHLTVTGEHRKLGVLSIPCPDFPTISFSSSRLLLPCYLRPVIPVKTFVYLHTCTGLLGSSASSMMSYLSIAPTTVCLWGHLISSKWYVCFSFLFSLFGVNF